MTTEQRQKQLKRLAHSSEGEALREYFQELIVKMTDARNYESSDFENEGRASVKAAEVLMKIIKTLKLKDTKKPKDHKEYI